MTRAVLDASRMRHRGLLGVFDHEIRLPAILHQSGHSGFDHTESGAGMKLAREPKRCGVPVTRDPIPERDRGARQTCEGPHRDLIGLLDLLREGHDCHDGKHKGHQHEPGAV